MLYGLNKSIFIKLGNQCNMEKEPYRLVNFRSNNSRYYQLQALCSSKESVPCPLRQETDKKKLRLHLHFYNNLFLEKSPSQAKPQCGEKRC